MILAFFVILPLQYVLVSTRHFDLFSVLIPVYNEEGVLDALFARLYPALDALGTPVEHYQIVDLSGTLRERQAQRLARFAPRVQWLDQWPQEIHGVLVANELLD
ncbi:hypothetical protein FKK32_30320, partial [Klebsiella pneumoniae]|nr:hypothetical protein [Klebsiella pneumoniae]